MRTPAPAGVPLKKSVISMPSGRKTWGSLSNSWITIVSPLDRLYIEAPGLYPDAVIFLRLAVCCASAQNRIKIHKSEFLYRANCIKSPIIEDFLHIHAKNPQM
jgi:hypothetical protein